MQNEEIIKQQSGRLYFFEAIKPRQTPKLFDSQSGNKLSPLQS